MLSDVAHEKKLTCKELAVHLIGLNREQSAEMTNRLLVQSLSSVGPAKWMGIKLVPSLDKGHDSFPEAFYREEMTVSQALRLEDAKPYLNHVQPGCVEGDKMNHNAFVGRLKPLAALGACSEGCIGDPAELGHGKTEIVVVVRAEVVHEIVDLGVRGMDSNMGGKNPTKGVPIMSGGTLAVDLSGGWIQEGEEIRCAISPIIKVLKGRVMRRYWQGGCETVEGLNARALVETIQILRGVGITFDDMFHFGKEIRIGDLEVVLMAVGPKGVFQENPMDG